MKVNGKSSVNLMFKLIATAVVFLGLDAIYLSTISPFYKAMVKTIQGSPMKFRPFSAIIVYIFLIVGLFYFIIAPNKTPAEAALLGAVIYGTYDFTNHTLLKNYSFTIGVIDTIWGAVLHYLTTYIVQFIF